MERIRAALDPFTTQQDAARSKTETSGILYRQNLASTERANAGRNAHIAPFCDFQLET
jgi:hypothetical protein